MPIREIIEKLFNPKHYFVSECCTIDEKIKTFDEDFYLDSASPLNMVKIYPPYVIPVCF